MQSDECERYASRYAAAAPFMGQEKRMTVQELAELIKESATVVGGALAVGGVVALFVIDLDRDRLAGELANAAAVLEGRQDEWSPVIWFTLGAVAGAALVYGATP